LRDILKDKRAMMMLGSILAVFIVGVVLMCGCGGERAPSNIEPPGPFCSMCRVYCSVDAFCGMGRGLHSCEETEEFHDEQEAECISCCDPEDILCEVDCNGKAGLCDGMAICYE